MSALIEGRDYTASICRDDIYLGVLSRTIIPRTGEYLSNEDFGQLYVREDNKPALFTDERKIVFAKDEDIGFDLHNRVHGAFPGYFLYDEDLGDYERPENGMLFIRAFRPYGDLLEFLGIPEEISTFDIHKVNKILLSRETHVLSYKHTVDLNDKVMSERYCNAINRQANNLHEFIATFDYLSDKTTPYEKEYAKIRKIALR